MLKKKKLKCRFTTCTHLVVNVRVKVIKQEIYNIGIV